MIGNHTCVSGFNPQDATEGSIFEHVERVEPEFDSARSWDQSLVALCPTCFHDYSHQSWCAAFGRIGGEDGEVQGWLISDSIREEVDAGQNPSARRHGLRIAINGECGHTWFLTIAQHKGQTLIGYEVPA